MGAAVVALAISHIQAGNESSSRVPKDRIRTAPPAARLVATTNVGHCLASISFNCSDGLWPPSAAVAMIVFISSSRIFSLNVAFGLSEVLLKTFLERVLYLKMASSTDYMLTTVNICP